MPLPSGRAAARCFTALLRLANLSAACRRRGFADEVYRIVVPRHPGAAMSAAATSPGATLCGTAPLGVPLPQHTSTGGVELAQHVERAAEGTRTREEAGAGSSVGQQGR